MGRIIVVGDMPESGAALGCDVSYAQLPSAVDWRHPAAISEGIGWAMVRLSRGRHYDYEARPGDTSNARARQHWENARRASLSVGGYHFVDEAPAQEQIDRFLGELGRVGCKGDDIAPCLDLEWLPAAGKPGGRLPFDHDGYCAIVDALVDAITAEYGGCWLYTCTGFWSAVGGPLSWRKLQWWVPWYPRVGFTEADARTHERPPSMGAGSGPAAWQYGCPPAQWDGNGPVDRNLAWRLPMIAEV